MSASQQSKAFSWRRIRKNLKQMVRNCTPPVIQKLVVPSDKSGTREKETGPESLSAEATEPVQFNLPVTDPDLIWPGFNETSIQMFPSQIRRHLWAMPENELMILATICKVLQPEKVFEFGTFTGASTLAIASNSREDVEVHTLDIPPANRKSHRTGVGSDIPFEFEIGQAFRATSWEARIHIHTGDTKQFDISEFRQQMDLVFIDADHTYSFVKNDTEKALEMLKPGGVILWHDYRWDDISPECEGVTRFVNEFFEQAGDCHEIAGTRFAVYQSPVSEYREAAA